MPIIKSARKRVRIAAKQSIQNAKTKRSMRETIKAFRSALQAKKDTTALQSEAYSAIDTAVKKGVISKNRAARTKSHLNEASKIAGTTKPGARATKKSADSTQKNASTKTTAKGKKAKTKAKTTSEKKASKPATKTTSAKKPSKK